MKADLGFFFSDSHMKDLEEDSGGNDWPSVALHVVVGYLLLQPTLGQRMIGACLEDVG